MSKADQQHERSDAYLKAWTSTAGLEALAAYALRLLRDLNQLPALPAHEREQVRIRLEELGAMFPHFAEQADRDLDRLVASLEPEPE